MKVVSLNKENVILQIITAVDNNTITKVVQYLICIVLTLGSVLALKMKKISLMHRLITITEKNASVMFQKMVSAEDKIISQLVQYLVCFVLTWEYVVTQVNISTMHKLNTTIEQNVQ